MWSSVVVILICRFSFSAGKSIANSALEGLQDQEAIASAFSDSRGFYPSFDGYDEHPLGHSRPFYFNQQQEGAYSQRSQPFEQRYDEPEKFSGFKGSAEPPVAKQETHGLLGSGNFGVIPGGTFYPDEKGASSSYEDYDSYLYNGHGRPSFFFDKPSGSKQYKTQQFANFKDFADINVPNGGQYSQYVTVYINKNGSDEVLPSSNSKVFRPKNIIESLALLDKEENTDIENVPEQKLSKSKRKLAKLLPHKKWLVKTSDKKYLIKEEPSEEPLLALS